LDFGKGVGILLPSISKLSMNVYGCDTDQKSIEMAQRMVREFNSNNVHLFTVEPENELSLFEAKTFDRIIAAEVLEHIPHAANVVSEFRRVLTDDGLLVASLPTESWLYSILSQKAKSGHIHSLNELTSMITAKFSIKKSFNLYDFFKIVVCEKRLC
jgi:2-polyprenyl-3-methyl-5-hydroxy-6-metoxy-1,4-benzoquinol methylase